MAEQNTVEIPLLLENVLRYCLKDARERMEKGEEIAPFSALAVGETLFMEEHDGETADECFESARRTVSRASGARAYGFCYDGYVELQTGNSDALIAQGGMPGEPYGHAIGLLYTRDKDGVLKFRAEPIYVGPAMNYMLSLTISDDSESSEAEQSDKTAETGEEAE